MTRELRRAWVAYLTVGLVCCARERQTEPREEGSTGVASAAQVYNSATVLNSAQVSDGRAQLQPRLEAIVESCNIEPATGVVTQCSGDEYRQLLGDVQHGRVSRTQLLVALDRALPPEAQDPPARVNLLCKLLEATSRSTLDGVAPNPTLTKSLLGKITRLSEPKARQVLPAVVHLSLLSELDEHLYAALDGLPNVELRALGYSFLHKYGSGRELPKLQTLIGAGSEPLIEAAVDSLRRIATIAEGDRAQLCNLLLQRVEGLGQTAANSVLTYLVSCPSPQVDRLLDRLETNGRSRRLQPETIRALDALCLTRQAGPRGTQGQCTRWRKVLERTVGDEAAQKPARQAALLSLGLAFRDQRTQTLASRLARSQGPLAATAQRVLGSGRFEGTGIEAAPTDHR